MQHGSRSLGGMTCTVCLRSLAPWYVVKYLAYEMGKTSWTYSHNLFMVVDGALLLVIVGAIVLFTGARDGCFVETKTSIEGT